MAMICTIFRCDASLTIGTGHVVRCRTLARGLQLRGAQAIFLCRPQSGDFIGQLEEEFSVLVLPALPSLANEGLQGRDLYKAWLGCSQEEDATDCLQALSSAGIHTANWLVVDHYGLDVTWETQMLSGLGMTGQSPRLLALDDLADRSHSASILVDPNRLPGCSSDVYAKLVSPDCRRFLGPAFAPLAPLYGELQPLSPRRSYLRRLLVFFGGVDMGNHCSSALRAVSDPALASIAVDVVLGKGAPHHDAVMLLVRQRPNTILHQDLPSLAGLILRADLAIGAAGTTSWERAALALPSLVIAVADNQVQGVNALAQVGAALALDLSDNEELSARLSRLLLVFQSEPERLVSLSDAARSLTDGRGVGRLVAAMLGPLPPFRLRPANAGDEGLYFFWANDPVVREQSFNHELIELDQHRRWFHQRLSSSRVLLRVLVDAQNFPLGQIRLERTDPSISRAVIGFSLDPAARGHGLASKLLQLGWRELTRQWGESFEAYGEVLQTNPASCKAFLRAGFLEGSAPRPGVRCFLRKASA